MELHVRDVLDDRAADGQHDTDEEPEVDDVHLAEHEVDGDGGKQHDEGLAHELEEEPERAVLDNALSSHFLVAPVVHFLEDSREEDEASALDEEEGEQREVDPALHVVEAVVVDEEGETDGEVVEEPAEIDPGVGVGQHGEGVEKQVAGERNGQGEQRH